VAQRFRSPTQAEHAAIFRVVATLRRGGTKSTGKLHVELYPNREMSRDAFEEVLGAMARAGLVNLADAVFEKNGKQIPYRKVGLTRAGYAVDQRTPIDFIVKETAPPSAKRKRKKKPAVSEGQKRASRSVTAAGTNSVAKAKGLEGGKESRLEAALRAWRLAEARRRGLPAFRIFNDRTLRALATSRPVTAQELLAIPGIGISTQEKYGRDICRVLRENGS